MKEEVEFQVRLWPFSSHEKMRSPCWTSEMCECQERLQIPVRQTDRQRSGQHQTGDGGRGLQDTELMGLEQQLVEVQQGRGEVVALRNQHIPPEVFQTCSYTFNYRHVLEELLQDHKDAVIMFILICLKSESCLLDSVHGAEAKLHQPGGQTILITRPLFYCSLHAP